MKILLFVLAAIAGYCVGGWNPAITLSKLIYKKDIRTCGSGNPGFTNFRRNFGDKWAWWVMGLDMSKAAVVCAVFAWIMHHNWGIWQLAAAYTGAWAMIGHAFPAWYKFQGGKGFLVCVSTVSIVDWRVGMAAFGIMVILLFTTKYMSLSTMVAMLLSPVGLVLLKADTVAVVLVAAMVVFMTVRHRENILRLFKGTERKFFSEKKKE